MTTPATSTTSTPGTAAAGSAVLGPDPARTSSAPEVEPTDTAAAVVVDVDGPPLPTVAVYRDEDGREHYASPFSKATRDRVAAGEWTEVDGSASPFDPTGELVRDVVAYLDEHAGDQAEIDRVKQAEAAGENRPTIAAWSPAGE